MRAILRRRPSPAMVVSVAALIVAMGGTSYAAIVLPANSVGTKQLKNNAVTSPKIARNAVTSSKVKPGSLRRSDFAAGQLPAAVHGFASVNSNSTFESPPKGFKAVARPSGVPTGVYCLTPAAGSGINTVDPNAIASPEFGHSGGSRMLAFAVNGPKIDCPGGTVEVQTFDLGGNLSNNVAFTIIVP